jgi:hypothetical protein
MSNDQVEKPKRTGFIEEATPENLHKLDEMGKLLAKVFELEKAKMNCYEELWKIYQRDCKRFGVLPRARVTR